MPPPTDIELGLVSMVTEPRVSLPPSTLGRVVDVLKLKPVLHLPWPDLEPPWRARERAAEAVAAKDESLALVAHELRNALGPMRLAAQMLETPGLAAAASEKARGIINRQLQSMTRLVADLLDGARITRGTLDVRLAPTDLTAVLSRVSEMMEGQVKQRDQRLTVSLPAEPWTVMGDAMRLDQVFGNLLSNASKFTRQGGLIFLSAEQAAAPDGRLAIVVRIRDDGIGIAADVSPHVFDLFTRPGRSPHHAQGLGVGLALVRRLVELHGGHVSVHSAGLDRGSEFVVTLPLLNAVTTDSRPSA